MENVSTQGNPSQRARLLTAIPKGIIFAIQGGINRAADFLGRFHVSPNAISVIGFVAGVGAGALFALDHPVWAALLVILSGLLDILDGRLAVNSHKKSLTGAIFDSTLDRYSEFFMYFGLAVHFRGGWGVWIPFFAFLGSAMVSYTRARAEGLGIDCRVGLMQRAERIILIVAGALAGGVFRVFDTVMIIVLLIIAVISNFTAFQRVRYVRKVEIQLKKDKEA